MKSTHGIIKAAAIISIVGLVYCLGVYLYTQPLLTPAMPEIPPKIQYIGIPVLPVMAVDGLYHVFLLVNALKVLADKKEKIFGHSMYIIAIIFSGITLFSDVTLLSDIFKEYKLWSVDEQWWMLYGFTVFHLVVVIYGTIFSRKNMAADKRLFAEIKNGNDAMFISMHQIGFVCALLGLAGVLLSMSGLLGTIITERFRLAWMVLLSCLALCPLILFAVYWAIKNRKKPLSGWLDEKQMFDTAAGALVSMATALPLVIVMAAVSVFAAGLPAAFWLSLLFFIALTVFSGTVAARNRIAD